MPKTKPATTPARRAGSFRVAPARFPAWRRALLGLCLLGVGAASAAPVLATASGVLLNDRGDILTAAHAVDGCRRLYAMKDDKVVRARVRARDPHQDLAVLASSLRPLLAATLAEQLDLTPGQPLFVAGYSRLRRGPETRGLLYNAVLRHGGDRTLTLMAPAAEGDSGSAVLDSGGRVVGLILQWRRLPMNPAPRRTVRARAGTAVKQFLRQQGVPFHASRRPTLDTLQPKAPRAATLAVGLFCDRARL